MKKNLMLLFCAVIIATFSSFSQKVVLKSGSVSALKGQTELNLTFNYDNLSVGKYEVESEYIDKKVADYNSKNPGTGDTWKAAWFNDRPTKYEPKFVETYNKYCGEYKADTGKTSAQYTLDIHTTFIEPGWNVGVSRQDAIINATITVKETATGNEIAVVDVLNCPTYNSAMGYDFDAAFRIAECYSLLGKTIASYIVKNTKK
jgi:hypothetical protein